MVPDSAFVQCDTCGATIDEDDDRLELAYHRPSKDATYDHVYCSPDCLVDYVDGER